MPFKKGVIHTPPSPKWEQIKAWLYSIEERSKDYRDKDEVKYLASREFTYSQYLKSCIYHPKQKGQVETIYNNLMYCGYIERIARGRYRLCVPPPKELRFSELRAMACSILERDGRKIKRTTPLDPEKSNRKKYPPIGI